nr:M48 family metalloprotease [Flavobacterium sp. NKUCC04_CG]
MKFAYLLFFTCCYTLVCAQQPTLIDTLSPVQKSILKADYNKRKTVFFAQLNESLNKKQSKEIKSVFEESYKEIQQKIDQNKILYGTPFNDYLNTLAKTIQQENPEIPKNLSLLVSIESQTNAHNRGEGTIVIYNYLLNALDNEDQLVYILCHEMAHQTLDHVLKSVTKYVQSNNSEELIAKTKKLKKQKYSRKTSAENLLKEIIYNNSAESRKRETQADSLGYIFYSRLNRNPHQVTRSLEKLRDSDIESDSLTPQDYTKILESFQVQIKDKWFKMERFDQYHYQKNTRFNTDSLRSHPNIDVRIEQLISLAPEIKGYEQVATLKTSSSEEFILWQQSAIYQNIQNEYILKNYGNSLYEALKLYNRKPNDQVKNWIGLNLQKIYEAKQTYKLNKFVSQVNVAKYTHSYNLFSSFIFNLSLSDLESIYKSI